ncbi:craniofacial development protein 2 [Plakobranchus ocellatus]|uniref:Craniofacial development protein 2 n=1 Tax=Plakobranchus ocellatus TaxID=259542 RepID=A0AAV4ADX5_9GAST|nr:craniofacial development protein 2 [Plakobranchus ocellatus]
MGTALIEGNCNPLWVTFAKKIMSRPKIKSKNDVKEGSCFKSIPVSSGRESYVPQVTPDRHQATARKMKDKLNIVTWNIRTLLQKGKLENIKQEMERMKLNILGLSEVRWKGAGKITSGGHEIIYSGGTESEKGVGIIVDQTVTKAIKVYWALSDRVLLVKIAGKPVDLNIIQVYAPTAKSNDEDLDKFYNELDTAKTQCKSQDPLIIMGDFNAKVGTEKVDDIVGKHGLGNRNERVQNKFEALGDAEEVEQQWKNFKSAIMEAATEVIPKVKRKAKQKWMTEEILNLMEERRCAMGNKEKYEQIHKKVQEKCNMSKENWINEKCKEIEQQRKHAPQTMYRNIEEITGKRTFLSTGCIKAMNGDIIIDKEKILERWAEYIRELFKDDRKDHNIMKNNFAGPPIMKEEVETAIKKMKHVKATGPDNISVELIEALEDFGIGKVTDLLNEIYDTGQIPKDLSKSIFIALPNKPGATECELHRTISLMSHITKILLKIIMLRIRNKIKPEIAEEQYGFVEDKGTSNAKYILRTLIERALEVQKDVRGMSEKKQEKEHNSKSFDQINLKLTQIEVHSFTISQRNPRGDRCIFASVTAANWYPLERNQRQDYQTNSSIH